MKKTLSLFLLFELVILILILMLTKGELAFHISETTVLTEHASNLKYDQNYVVNHPMKYLINIESENVEQQATLLWPTPPFGKFLVLVPYQSEELKEQQLFSGKLVRCLYKCLVGEMYIEMFDFVKSLEERFPDYKGKYSTLPAIILDASVKPLGWMGYIQLTRYYWYGFLILSVVAFGVLIWRMMRP